MLFGPQRDFNNCHVDTRTGCDDKDILRFDMIARENRLSSLKVALDIRAYYALKRPACSQREISQVDPVDRHKPSGATCQFHREGARMTRSVCLDHAILLK